ncbi:MAG: T9SS type A sorting domain-containing protein [Bacteroidetes bacterium]|jgi:hypothetical protein|nr:T9SS type A sorting domain-containing protein [Bacteroidota bacterium]
MKKLSLLTLIFALFFGTAAMAQSMPNDWFTDEVNPGADVHLFQETENVYDGDYSCKAVLLQPEVPYMLSFTFDVTAGEEYTYSLWYFDNDPLISIKVYAEFYDADGGDIYGEDPVFGQDGDTWQNISWTGTVPEGAVAGYAWIKFYDDEGFVDNGTVYLDNVSFEVGGQNLVANGGFELWDGVGTIEQSASSVKVYPNPFNDQLTISGAEFDQIRIQNLLGQVVIDRALQSGEKVATANLESGIYFVTVLKANRVVETRKLFKE